MIIKRFIVSEFQTNCYIISIDKDAYIIDPGDNSKKILNYIEEKALNINGILLTHGHIDHIKAVEPIYDKYHCKIYINENDNALLTDPNLNLSGLFSNKPFILRSNVLNVQKIEDKNFKIEFINTPGHTPGSSIIIVNNEYMFSGDTLFNLSIGRTDFPASSNSDMKKSLTVISRLTNDYKVYPGHGESTTLNFEKENNPYLKS